MADTVVAQRTDCENGVLGLDAFEVDEIGIGPYTGAASAHPVEPYKVVDPAALRQRHRGVGNVPVVIENFVR